MKNNKKLIQNWEPVTMEEVKRVSDKHKELYGCNLMSVNSTKLSVKRACREVAKKFYEDNNYQIKE